MNSPVRKRHSEQEHEPERKLYSFSQIELSEITANNYTQPFFIPNGSKGTEGKLHTCAFLDEYMKLINKRNFTCWIMIPCSVQKLTSGRGAGAG